jgi:hypothetical protein
MDKVHVSKPFDTFYYGSFNGKKAMEIGEYTHVYNDVPWKIHNFIGILPIEDLSFLANLYRNFIWFEGDDEKVRDTLIALGCERIK